MLTTEECPEMNVGTGKFSDDVEMMYCGYQSRCGGSSRLVCILVKYLVRGQGW